MVKIIRTNIQSHRSMIIVATKRAVYLRGKSRKENASRYRDIYPLFSLISKLNCVAKYCYVFAWSLLSKGITIMQVYDKIFGNGAFIGGGSDNQHNNSQPSSSYLSCTSHGWSVEICRNIMFLFVGFDTAQLSPVWHIISSSIYSCCSCSFSFHFHD